MIADSSQLITLVARTATNEEKAALATWLESLLEIRASSSTPRSKVERALRLTSKSAVIRPVLEILWREIRKHGWDDRSLVARFGIVGVSAGLALFGGQSAGVAALGTAVGVPLWVVVGSGATVAGALVKEFKHS